jgi:hypothetical protein
VLHVVMFQEQDREAATLRDPLLPIKDSSDDEDEEVLWQGDVQLHVASEAADPVDWKFIAKRKRRNSMATISTLSKSDGRVT